LPEYAAPKPEKNRRKQRQADLESKKKDEEEGVVEDVEIYSIDKGWSDEYAEQFADEIDISDEASTREQPKEKSRRKKPALAATDQDEPTGKGSSTKDDKPKLDKAKQKELSELEELLKAEGFDPDDLDLDLNSFVLEGLDDLDLDLDSSGELDEGNVWPEATTDFKSDAWLEYERKLREQLDQPDADVDESPEGGADFDLGFDDLDEEESGGAARGGAATIVTGDGGRAELNQTETEDEDDEDSEDDEEEDLDAAWTVSDVPEGYEIKKSAQATKGLRGGLISRGVQRALDSIPETSMRKLRLLEEEADVAALGTTSQARKKAEERRKTHRRLRIIAGSAGGKRLLSPQGDVVRPMMEMVKAAVFSMIQARLGGAPQLPEGSRWLDLFAGTGNIGLEALSRGCAAAHFIELDPWVAKTCLQRNIDTCNMKDSATMHITKAETFLQRAVKTPGFAGGAFDFISVCPPYLLVSYPELFGLLEQGGLAKPTSIILVEYPKRLAHQIPDTLCGLPKIRDRKYGRTFLALYAPNDEDEEEDDEVYQRYV